MERYFEFKINESYGVMENKMVIVSNIVPIRHTT